MEKKRLIFLLQGFSSYPEIDQPSSHLRILSCTDDHICSADIYAYGSQRFRVYFFKPVPIFLYFKQITKSFISFSCALFNVYHAFFIRQSCDFTLFV